MPDEGVRATRQPTDPVVWWLTVGIIFLIVSALVAVLYAFLAGSVTPSTPRTLVESQLVLLKNAAVTYPKSGSARQAYILALEASGQKDAATTEYTNALKQVTGIERTQVYAAGVTLLFNRKDYAGTVKLATEAIASDDAARKVVASGQIAKGVGAAAVDYGEGDNNARITILFTGARALGATGDWQGAVKNLSESISLDPEGADLLVYRATAYTKLGQNDKAIADYKKALAFIPDYPPAVAGLKQLQGK